MKTITQIAMEKKSEYQQENDTWTRQHEGQKSQALSSKIIGADMAIYCDHGDDLRTFIKVFNRKGKAMNKNGQNHGHFFIALAIEDILDDYQNQIDGL